MDAARWTQVRVSLADSILDLALSSSLVNSKAGESALYLHPANGIQGQAAAAASGCVIGSFTTRARSSLSAADKRPLDSHFSGWRRRAR